MSGSSSFRAEVDAFLRDDGPAADVSATEWRARLARLECLRLAIYAQALDPIEIAREYERFVVGSISQAGRDE